MDSWHTLTPAEREFIRADFAKECNVCTRCGALFHHSRGHVWSGTLKDGNAKELASLVCDRINDERCANPLKGTTDGKGWEARQVVAQLAGLSMERIIAEYSELEKA